MWKEFIWLQRLNDNFVIDDVFRAENTFDLLGEDCYVLGHLMYTLGIVMYAAANSPVCTHIDSASEPKFIKHL